ncbi:MAG: hypothetical protein C0624_06565 [Desulfuromonas sp.]|nr:MAG: hypothetical protein C0624_06565 [Desulfuromonas sp.]
MPTLDLDNLPTGAALLSRSGKILRINRYLKSLLSIQTDTDFSPCALHHLHPQDQPWVRDLFASVARNETDRAECCLRILSAQHKPIWTLLSTQIYQRATPPRKTLLVIVHDMSLEREMLDELEPHRTLLT